MTDITICIPVAPYHKDVLGRALDSVKAQTIAARCLYMIDEDGDGPGFVRNRLLAQVTTPYVVFLDADDWLEPEFLEACLNEITPGRYIYTDWYQDDTVVKAPDKAWCGGSWHVITSLLHTQDAKHVGGFNETLPAVEDTDFYLKLVTRKICGARLPAPLFHYGKEGQRAKIALKNGSMAVIRSQLLEKYGGMMGCCGENNNVDDMIPVGTKQAGDVLAMALWQGNRVQRGFATGRHYPRLSYPRTTWVDPADIERRPDMWQQVIEPALVDEVAYQGIDGLEQAMIAGGMIKEADYVPVLADVKPIPDAATITRIAKKKLT